MSASQPIRPVQNVGNLSSTNSTAVTKDAIVIKTGTLSISVTDGKKSGHIGVCNTTTSGGVGLVTCHVNKNGEKLLRVGHPASATVTAATAANPTVLTLNHPDTKIKVGDYVTISGSSVGDYNAVHKEVTAVSSPQRSNEYAQTITVSHDASGAGAFTGTATVAKSVIPVLYPASSSGCDAYVQEVQVG